MSNERYVVFRGHMLTNIRTGEHTVWSYYSDGSCEETKELLSPAFIPAIPFNVWWI